ncbi:MAG: TIGR02266 family protein [Deltaproteobacteria bacterium]|nr:TIGR02266 family protein [Deltaproteobacteria bacterium]
MANEFHDRRESPRIPIEIPICYSHINTFFYDYIKNISLGGTFIKTSNYLPVGTKFRFTIKLPNIETELNLNAEVVWVREKEENIGNNTLPQGMGIKFIFDSEEEQRRFNEKIEKLMRKHLGDKIVDRLLNKR